MRTIADFTLETGLTTSTESTSVRGPAFVRQHGRKGEYLDLLRSRLAAGRSNLSKVRSLSEQWDNEVESNTATESDRTELQDLRPFLAVDTTILEGEISHLLQQIKLVERCGFPISEEPVEFHLDA